MEVSIHPIVDQMAQWWVALVCNKSSRWLKLSEQDRYLLVMDILKRSGHAVEKVLDQKEFLDPPELVSRVFSKKFLELKWRKLQSNSFRQLSEKENALFDAFHSSVGDCVDDTANWQSCIDTLYGIFSAIDANLFAIVGWDEEGCMICKVTSNGDEHFKVGDEYVVSFRDGKIPESMANCLN